MARTKKDLEYELSILEGCYETLRNERSFYLSIIIDIVYNHPFLARFDLNDEAHRNYLLFYMRDGKLLSDLKDYLRKMER